MSPWNRSVKAGAVRCKVSEEFLGTLCIYNMFFFCFFQTFFLVGLIACCLLEFFFFNYFEGLCLWCFFVSWILKEIHPEKVLLCFADVLQLYSRRPEMAGPTH